jgi:hypothetical protein
MSLWPGLSFVENAEVAFRQSAFYLCVSALYFAANMAAFSYRRRWVVAALAFGCIVIAATGADWVKSGRFVLQFDPLTFWVGLSSWLVAHGLVVYLLVALASVLRLPPRQRDLLCPLSSPKLFPRRSFRTMTVLPDVIDFVPTRRARLWISFQYMAAAGLFLMLPSHLLQSHAVFIDGLNNAIQVCGDERGEALRACVLRSIHAQVLFFTLLAFVALIVGWLVAPRLLARAQRRLTFSLEDVTRVDGRPPILFLRSFADDQVAQRQTEMSWLQHIVQGRPQTAPSSMCSCSGLRPSAPWSRSADRPTSSSRTVRREPICPATTGTAKSSGSWRRHRTWSSCWTIPKGCSGNLNRSPLETTMPSASSSSIPDSQRAPTTSHCSGAWRAGVSSRRSF